MHLIRYVVVICLIEECVVGESADELNIAYPFGVYRQP